MNNSLVARGARGALGGLLATVAMSGAMYAAKMLGMLGEPPPRKITRALLRGVGLRPRRPALNAASLAMHLGFGASMGALYGAMQTRRLDPRVAAAAGLAYGGLIWGSSYAGWVPRLAIMPRPMWDRPGRPTAMLAAHAVYGVALAEIVNLTEGSVPSAMAGERARANP